MFFRRRLRFKENFPYLSVDLALNRTVLAIHFVGPLFDQVNLGGMGSRAGPSMFCCGRPIVLLLLLALWKVSFHARASRRSPRRAVATAAGTDGAAPAPVAPDYHSPGACAVGLTTAGRCAAAPVPSRLSRPCLIPVGLQAGGERGSTSDARVWAWVRVYKGSHARAVDLVKLLRRHARARHCTVHTTPALVIYSTSVSTDAPIARPRAHDSFELDHASG